MKKIALVCLPFRTVNGPHLALSTFKAILSERGIPSTVLYLNKQLEQIFGLTPYSAMGKSAARIAYRWAFDDLSEDLTNLPYYPQNLIDAVGTPAHLDALTMYTIRNIFEDFMERNVSTLMEYDIICFTADESNLNSVIGMSKKIKSKDSSKIIIWGGPSVRMQIGTEYITKLPFVDVVFLRDAEFDFPDLICNLVQGRQLSEEILPPGTASRCPELVIKPPDESLLDVNAIPVPDYSDWTEHYPMNIAVIYLSKGCQYGAQKSPCSFCAEVSGFSSGHYLSRDPQKATEYILSALRRYPQTKRFTISDSMLSSKFINETIPEVSKGKPPDVEFMAEVKPWLSRKQVRILKDANFKELLTGIETLHPYLTAALNKGHRVCQAIALLRWCKLYDIQLKWSYLYDIPGQKQEWLDEQYNLIQNAFHLPSPTVILPVMITTFGSYLDNPEKWNLTNVVPLIVVPKNVDSNRVAWAWGVKGNFPRTPEQTIALLIKWIGQDYETLQEFSAWTLPVFLQRSKKPELKFQENGIFDSRFGREEVIPISGKQRSILVECDSPQSIEKLCSIHGNIENDISYLVDRRLIYKEPDIDLCVSYVESIPDD